MNKLGDHLSDPLDLVFYKLASYSLPLWKNLKLTPNILTTIGNIFGIFASYNMYNKNINLFTFCSLTRYFFDCADGAMARKYKMTSKFGDKYEHISDMLYGIILIITSYITYKDLKFIYLYMIVYLFLLINWSLESSVSDLKCDFYMKVISKTTASKLLRVFRFTGPAMSFLYIHAFYYFYSYFFNK